MKNIILTIGMVALATFLLISVKIQSQSEQAAGGAQKLQVVASFYPLAYFAERIGGDRVEVTNITPSGAEPHDYEPTTTDIQHIAQSDLLIVNGKGLESWSGKIQGKNMVTVSDGITNKMDPHTWLDPVFAQNILTHITNALVTLSPVSKSYFEMNEASLIEQLSALDTDYKTGLKNCSLHEIVTSHDAFGYLANRYGFTQIALSGLSPDEEPTPQKLMEVTNLVKEKNIHYIFFETLVSPRLAETLAKETNTQTLVFNPLEGLTSEESKNGADYFSVQRENLNSLRTALSCM